VTGRLAVLGRAFAEPTGPRLREGDEREDPAFGRVETIVDRAKASTNEVTLCGNDDLLVHGQRSKALG
jgi:hypothetical protein